MTGDGEWTFVDNTDESDTSDEAPSVGEPSDGVVLYTESGDPVRVTLMDEHDDRLQLTAHPEQGIYGYEGPHSTITMMLEKP